MRIGCAILAAGSGSRFDSTPAEKLVAKWRDKPLVQYAIDAASASAVSSCTLVLGADPERVLVQSDSRRCTVMVNEQWKEGLASSIRCALGAHAADDACILMLGDQPNVTAGDLDAIAASFAARPDAIVALRSGEIWGAPVLFPASDFRSLLGLRGDSGAKRLAALHRERLVFVDSRRPDAFADVDTAADLARLSIH